MGMFGSRRNLPITYGAVDELHNSTARLRDDAATVYQDARDRLASGQPPPIDQFFSPLGSTLRLLGDAGGVMTALPRGAAGAARDEIMGALQTLIRHGVIQHPGQGGGT